MSYDIVEATLLGREPMPWKFLQILSFIFATIAGISIVEPSIGREMGSLEGTWEGKLKIVGSSLEQDSNSYRQTVARYEETPFKIVINEMHARVYFGNTEIKPTLFRTQIFMTNAVVFASSSGDDADGQWVETWDFVLTLKNVQTLGACLSRVVNNLDVPEGEDFSKFFTIALGDLHRTSR